MANSSIDEYARSHESLARDPEGRDDVGRPVDHRPSPGAFGSEYEGYVMESEVPEPSSGVTAQSSGAAHHPPEVEVKPPAREPETLPPDEAGPAPAARAAHRPAHRPEGRLAAQAVGRVAARRTLKLLRRVERTAWGTGVLRSLLSTVVKIQRGSADRIERWLQEEPGLTHRA